MFDSGLTHRLRSFAFDEGGQEIAEFALILSVFSLVAITGFAILATISGTTAATQQNNLTNAALNPL